ncbi:MAG TPA: ABC transporter ATP-binding protein [Deltaproteobacteria bacterium]|nr:ABC transporter ATP-binding protein [Deltaproteobacteria bacterium]
MKIYLRLLDYLSPYKGTFAAAVVCMVVFALSNGAMAYLVGPALKFLFFSGGETPPEIRLIPFDLVRIERTSMVVAVPLAIIVVAVVKGASSFGQTYLMGYVGQRVVSDLRDELFAHILRLPVGYFSRTSSGELVSRVTNDTNMLQTATAEAVTQVFKNVLTIAVLLVVVVAMDWQMAIGALFIYPIAISPMVRLGKKMKRASTEGQATMANMTSVLNEALRGVRIVKAFCMEGYEAGRFRAENEGYTRHRIKQIKVKALSSPLMELLGAAGFAVTIWYATYRIASGTLTPEAFMSFCAAVLMLYQPVKALNGVNLNIQNGLAAAQRVFEVLDTEREPSGEGVKLRGVERAVVFDDVSFSYGPGKPVLRDVNLVVEKGEMIAIVGGSGAGKTTLVNLIPRFYDVTGGAVRIDGRDIRELDLGALRSLIAIVSQQVVLFNDTLGRNIAYGDPSRSREEVVEAARAANIHDFAASLPDGYDTIIGEGGVRLSGGEKQRVSIARAILKNAPILILDEATSALDTESELEVQKGLDNLMRGRTSFVIAHRLSTVRNADRIIVISGGTIKEAGRHEELLARSGEYRRLYDLQFPAAREAGA